MTINKKELLLTMDRDAIEDVVFFHSKAANNILYKGLANHLHDLEGQLRTVLSELDYIKTYIQTNTKGSKKKNNLNDDVMNLILSMTDDQKQEVLLKAEVKK